MMVMPFAWRPSPEQLENPWTNVFWGTRALATITKDGHGDIFYALAAYNGSWKKIQRANTQRYAASVLDHYTRAVAQRHGLSEEQSDWMAVITVEGMPGPRTLTVLGPNTPLTRYTERPLVQPDIPAVPAGTPPHAVAVEFVDDHGVSCQVLVWLLGPDGRPIPSTTRTADAPAPAQGAASLFPLGAALHHQQAASILP
jgi:hypothetical protein